MNKIFISTTSFATFSKKPLELLEAHNLKIELNQNGRKLTPKEIHTSLSECIGVIAGTELYSKDILEHLPKLKIISRLGVGLDNIDLSYAEQQNIEVFKTKTTPALAVAELTLGLILDLLRKISYQNNLMKSGIWEKGMGQLLSGKTLGIIGLGTIGKKLVEITSGINLQYLAYDINEDKSFSEQNDIRYVRLEDIFAKSDIISIHLNLTDETNQLMNATQINKMKSDSILINTSRGEIIDEEALYKALKEKKIIGAGLDVFNNEPYSGPLTKLDNAILTPHIGSYAKELRIQMEIEAVENLIRGLNEE